MAAKPGYEKRKKSNKLLLMKNLLAKSAMNTIKMVRYQISIISNASLQVKLDQIPYFARSYDSSAPTPDNPGCKGLAVSLALAGERPVFSFIFFSVIMTLIFFIKLHLSA